MQNANTIRKVRKRPQIDYHVLNRKVRRHRTSKQDPSYQNVEHNVRDQATAIQSRYLMQEKLTHL